MGARLSCTGVKLSTPGEKGHSDNTAGDPPLFARCYHLPQHEAAYYDARHDRQSIRYWVDYETCLGTHLPDDIEGHNREHNPRAMSDCPKCSHPVNAFLPAEVFSHDHLIQKRYDRAKTVEVECKQCAKFCRYKAE